MVYDIAQRIGAYLGKAPTLIYLHRGTKEGAAILGFHGETVDACKLPPAFSRLAPAEIEDCLCIYKDQLRGAPPQFHPNLHVVLQEGNGAPACDSGVLLPDSIEWTTASNPTGRWNRDPKHLELSQKI